MDIDNIKYLYIDKDEGLEEALNIISGSKILGVDTETTGLEPITNKIRLLQIAAVDKPVLVIDMFLISEAAKEKLKGIFNTDSVKVFQNAKFDLKFLMNNGFEIKGPVFDTMLAAQLINDGTGPRSAGLESLVSYYLGLKLPKEEQKSDFSGSLREAQIEYAAKDAAVLLPLRERLIEEIKAGKLIEVCKLEFDCVLAVADMELTGVKLHKEKWQKLYDKYVEEQKELTRKLTRELDEGGMQMNMFGEEIGVGINLDSQAQVIKALKKKGIELQSTTHAELVEYKDRHQAIEWLIEYRRVSKAIQGFLSPMWQYVSSVTGRIHSSYRQIGSGSGRFSCGNPNVQQIPRGKEFRECFVPEEGNKFIIADYSQIELRVAAEIARDKTMIEAYRAGQDLHALTAALVANKKIEEVTKSERQAAKAINFGLIYAMGAKGLQAYAKTVYGVDMKLEEAELFRDRFFRAYSGIAAWHAKMKKATNIKEIRTLSGRRCIFEGEAGITMLLNTPVQGTAADIAKKALGMLVPVAKGLNGHIIATVHDEILLEVPEERAEEAAIKLKETMEKAGAYYLKQIPVVAETIIADSWAEK
ncbi:bifunctional 3'-5' exonuclease/DNA polymerase [Clostridium swellfunianum]|uniref:bifunctional 3'-5' exonuclease/DNA polymerase n=1 Tax=Clostridium swellfunianum TaxID=1367462 RepID=UPI00203089EF|nr:bifunctional 3'-5' exonuclease/DNA polymerase [Clostridium swellfunianum]MCM0647170.1 bifunctional 3'-5' exonuclease/DNA polymerase [Clostridium swellfunianum]